MPRKRPTKPANGDAHGVADPFPDRTGQSVLTTGDPAFRLEQGVPRQLSPILTLFATSTTHILRLEDTRYNALALAVAREIRSGSLVIVLPTATKVFDLSALGPQPEQRSNLSQTPAPPPPDIPVDLREYVQGEDEEDEGPAPIIESEFQEPRVRHREHSPPADNSICGRCNGSGITLAGGGCPVCQGRGTIIAWGRGTRQ